jgi:branched-subunit amino acid transport protein
LDDQVAVVLAIALGGLITFGTRLSFIALMGHISAPEWFWRSLTFVPLAVFAAIVSSEMVAVDAAGVASLSLGRLIAGGLAVAVAWRSKNVLFTIGAGMAAIWLLQALAVT